MNPRMKRQRKVRARAKSKISMKQARKAVQKIEVGDFVEIKNCSIKKGIVFATEGFYLSKDHIDIQNRIVNRKDVTIIKKQIIPKKYQKYLTQ